MPLSDANLPPMTPSELPSSEGHSNPLATPDEGASGMLSLTDDQLQALGLQDCQPGDSYTIKLTKSDSADGSADFEVNDVQEGDDDSDDLPGQGEQGAVEAPDSDDEGIPGLNPSPDDKSATPPSDANAGSDADEKMIGYKRKSKKARGGLPDTKKMRE